MLQEDYYEVLQVGPRAAPEVIKKAFKVLAVEYHPDKYPYSKKKWAEARFRVLREAYEVLSDPALREEYDVIRASTKAGGGTSAEQDVEYERKTFYFLRQGLELYEGAVEGGLLDSLRGKWASELDKSRAHLLKVISSLPDTVLIEDALFYHFRALTRVCDYSDDYLESVLEEYELFLSDYPSSKWVPYLKLEMADFYASKWLEFGEAMTILEEIMEETPDEGLARACSARLAYLERESALRCTSCGRKLFYGKGICFRCRRRMEKGEGEESAGSAGIGLGE